MVFLDFTTSSHRDWQICSLAPPTTWKNVCWMQARGYKFGHLRFFSAQVLSHLRLQNTSFQGSTTKKTFVLPNPQDAQERVLTIDIKFFGIFSWSIIKVVVDRQPPWWVSLMFQSGSRKPSRADANYAVDASMIHSNRGSTINPCIPNVNAPIFKKISIWSKTSSSSCLCLCLDSACSIACNL